MQFIDRLKDLSNRAQRVIQQLTTEEATKNALVMPFINMLGYDVFDPTEVVPEFTADIGVKKGEKVDYALMKNGKPIILIECKSVGVDLDKEHASQLYRYFSASEVRFGILTNGIQWRIFSDLETPNKMDTRPFLQFSLFDLNEALAEQLEKFSKGSFEVNSIISIAGQLKYSMEIKRIIYDEWLNPSEDIVKIFASRVYQGRLTQTAKEHFGNIVKGALQGFIDERIRERFNTALSSGINLNVTNSTAKELNSKVITTEQELEGYYIIKSICCNIINAHRIFLRDNQSYCSIFLDDNNRKPICRFYFNGSQKYIVIIDLLKNNLRQNITIIDDIYKYSEQIREIIIHYEKGAKIKENNGTTSLDAAL